jgi:recombination protein RecR
MPSDRPINVTRIGFGLPSGGGVVYADAVTLKSALDARRSYR